MHRTFGSAEPLIFEMFGGSTEIPNFFFINRNLEISRKVSCYSVLEINNREFTLSSNFRDFRIQGSCGGLIAISVLCHMGVPKGGESGGCPPHMFENM